MLTIHELLLLHGYGKPWAVAFHVEGQDMESSASVMTFDRDGSHLMLHGEVVSYSSRAVPDEVECFRKSAAR